MPRATVVGSSTWHFPLLPFPNGSHVVRGVLAAFPKFTPTSGTPDAENYLPHSREKQQLPLGLGRRTFYDRGFVWDMTNVNSMWGVATLGPLRNSPAMTGGPATFLVFPGDGFFESSVLSRLFIFGSGGAANDESIWLMDGDDTAWTDATVNADFAADLRDFAGMEERNDSGTQRVYALLNQVTAIGGDNSLFISTTNGTTWIRRAAAASAENITAGTYNLNRAAFLRASQANGTQVFVCLYSSTTNAVTYEIFGITGTGAWTATGALTTPILESTAAPRGMQLFRTAAGAANGLFISINKGLFYVNPSPGTTFAKVLTYINPSGSYTGRFIVGPDNALWGIDGGKLWRWRWISDAGDYDFDRITVGQRMHPRTPQESTFTEGTPIDAYGDFTAIAFDTEKPWIYLAKGGLAASRQARIYIYDYEADLWHCPYQHGTAQRAILALIQSSLTGTQPRLHWAEESAAAGDQDPQYFDYINMNPFINTAATFSTTGVIDSTEFDGHAPTLYKGFYRTTLTTRSLTGTTSADERIQIQHSTNGGALSSAQTIGTSPVAGVWTDGAATALGTGAFLLQTRLTLLRGTTTTNSPKIFAVSQEYEVIGLKSDDTPIRTYTIRISLGHKAYAPGGVPETANAARAALETILRNGALVQLAVGEDLTTASPAKVRLLPFEMHSVVGDPGGSPGTGFDPRGWVDVTFAERI